MNFKSFLGLVALLVASFAAKAQLPGTISGNFQVDVQQYNKDSVIGTPDVPEKLRMNGFGNLNYTLGNFSAGIRYETYQPPLLGFDPNYRGSGIPYRYAAYSVGDLNVTLGNFYEQFGNGLILRAYEERGLGLDNAFDGIRVRYTPVKGLYLKGIYGRQRSFFSLGPGIVRGADAEFNLNEYSVKEGEVPPKLNVIVGAAVVSKYQQDQDPIYNLPENVSAFSGRLRLDYAKLSFTSEYAYKINDPSMFNSMIYKNGRALMTNLTYTGKGYGVILGAKYLDNMDFRSDRTATGNNLTLNFLPPIAKQHTYRLVTLYPFVTQARGEMGYSIEAFYLFKPGTLLGGTYGTNVSVNFVYVKDIDTTKYNDDRGYSSKFFTPGKNLYYQDFNIEISKKISKSFKTSLMYINMVYNKDALLGLGGYGTINAHMGIWETQIKIKPGHSLRTEVQALLTKTDRGSWVSGLLEYSVSPHWFFTIQDQWNYKNPHPEKEAHYYGANIGYAHGANRISIGYARQFEGLLCIGGICRNVPASSGLTLSISSSF